MAGELTQVGDPHRGRTGTRTAAALVALVVVLLLGGCAGATSAARDYSIDTVRIEAEVRADGTLVVDEWLTYTFTGADDRPFTVGTRDFELGGRSGTITSIAAFDEEDRPLATVLDTPTLFEWDIAPARSGTYTYRLRYEVDGAVQVGRDVAELYRMWIGDGFPQLDLVTVEVRVPEGDGELLVWAHGPLDGIVGVDQAASLVTAEVRDVPAGQFVETRTAIPVDRMSVPPGDADLLPSILGEEERWADEANAERERVRAAEERRATAQRAVNLLVVPLTGLGAWGFWMIWRRWGRDPKKPADIGDYWRDVPDDPPAVAAAFLKWNTVDGTAYSATILDMARRGHLRIEEEVRERVLRSDVTEHRFVKTAPRLPDELRPFERRAREWLFRDGDEITQEELVVRNRAEQTRSHSMWTSFQKEVQADLRARNYIVRGKQVAFGLHALIVVGLAGLAIAGLVLGAWFAAGLAGATALILLPLGVLHRSRTPHGTRRYWEWRGLQRFLKDFSRLDEAPAGHLVLWEQYLVAAVALGVAEELLEGLEVWFPEVLQEGSGFATWYVASSAGRGHGSVGAIGSFGSSFGTAAVSSSTPASSGSGGGGGFSGGGGGGGGGGGAGAR